MILLIASLAIAGLIKPSMNEAERYTAIAPFFSPAPGQIAEISPIQIRELTPQMNPLQLKGYITVRPPRGKCFIITRDPSLRDHRICKEEQIAFTAAMLDWDGSFTWKISTGEGDHGYDYRWLTPHRIAKVIGIEERPLHFFDKEVILGCHAHTGMGEKRIVLDIAKDRKWVIRFPEKDIFKRKPDESNPHQAYFDPLATSEATSSLKLGTSSSKPERDPREVAQKNAKAKEPTSTYWMMSEYGAYTMSVNNFSTSDTPTGLPGECLYQYKDAYRDPDSGWIECHLSDSHDVVYAPLSCAPEIAKSKAL